MAQDLTLIEAPQLPADPARMTSLPEWLRHRSDALANADRQHYRPLQRIPASLILSQPGRAVVEAHIADLSRFLDLSQPFVLREQLLTNSQAHSVMIAGLLMKKGTRPDKAMADQLTDDYLDAIEDLPAWCVREALRKWNRGESVELDKKPHDFTWRPEPATLARLARIERGGVQGRIHILTRLLGAEGEPEYTGEQRVEMIDKLAVILPSMQFELPERRRPEAAE